jgi:DNA helicase-2/ATP-dependent DNA helicase PcrA
MQLTNKQRQILESEGHLLVTGGPGSGKTTVSILKASVDCREEPPFGATCPVHQFRARFCLSRYGSDSLRNDRSARNQAENRSRHLSRILLAHPQNAWLSNRTARSLSILTPPQVAIAFSDLRGTFAGIPDPERLKREFDEKTRLAKEDGKVCFDLFADYAAEMVPQLYVAIASRQRGCGHASRFWRYDANGK